MKHTVLRGVRVTLTSAIILGAFAPQIFAAGPQQMPVYPYQQMPQQMPAYPQMPMQQMPGYSQMPPQAQQQMPVYPQMPPQMQGYPQMPPQARQPMPAYPQQQQMMPNFGPNNYGPNRNRPNNFGPNNYRNNPSNMNMNTRDWMPSNGWDSGDIMDSMPWGGDNNNGWGDTPPWGDWQDGNYPWGNDIFGDTPPWGNRITWPEDYPTDWGNGMPLENPMETGGQWAHPKFTPWKTGPFGGSQWNEDHPMNNTPWGRFPNWGDNFFGDYGPGTWKGITPWGNDVPFRWIDPNDPKGMVELMWDDAINTPSDMGRMPPGWTPPSISVPNPIEVGEEFERNAAKFPTEMNKMNSSYDSSNDK